MKTRKKGITLEKQIITKPLYLRDTTYTGDIDWEAELEIISGEVNVLVNVFEDGRIYYTAFSFKDDKCWTRTDMRDSKGKLIPNCGGLRASQEVMEYLNKNHKSLPLHKQLNGWDGHSRKGQAVYDAIFEQEKKDQEKYDPSDRYGFYEGID